MLENIVLAGGQVFGKWLGEGIKQGSGIYGPIFGIISAIIIVGLLSSGWYFLKIKPWLKSRKEKRTLK